MISVNQIRAARALVGLECRLSSKRSGVGSYHLGAMRLQRVSHANTRILSAVKSVLESAGIEFTGDPLVNPGVTLRIKRDD
jgi:hypothetical protein